MHDESLLEEYFTDVADPSPLLITLYNYPGAVAGIDMDSDLVIRISRHPNKRVAIPGNLPASRVLLMRQGRDTPGVDTWRSTLASGGSGVIAGGANVLPRTIVKVWDLWTQGKMEEAMELQEVLSQGDWVLTKGAIAGTKSANRSYYGYGGMPRRPLKGLGEGGVRTIKDGVDEVMKVEMGLPDKHREKE